MKIENTNETIKKEKVTKVNKTALSITEDNLGELIPEWKAKYGRIYKNIVDGDVFIWKAIRRKEYRELLKMNDDIDADERFLLKQESVVQMATLFPENISSFIESKAGLATVLSEEILARSGFDISETESL